MVAFISWLWSIVKGILNGAVRLLVVLVLIITGFTLVGMLRGDGLPPRMVLTLDLRAPIEDKTPYDPFAFVDGRHSVMDIVMALDAAERDPRVAGVFLRVGNAGLMVPQAEELADAITRFRASGKFVLAHSQSFYTTGLGDYVVASAADEIWMQPSSVFMTSGTAMTVLFLRGLLDEIEAEPQIARRSEFKGAADTYLERDFTPAHRESSLRVLQSWYEEATARAAARRKLATATLQRRLDEGPYFAQQAQARGLIDALGFDDDAQDAAIARAGDDAKPVPLARFAEAKKAFGEVLPGPRIALVHAAGPIVDGGGAGDPFGGENMVGGDTFAEALRNAAEDASVRAILLRIDSPGGSVVASDQILDAVKKAQAAGKPVIVSMGALAASGGYYIALAADRIVAEPGTLTGSIGVYWGKVGIGKTLGLIGVDARSLKVGENALYDSPFEPFTPEQLQIVEAQADFIYDDFTKKVAEGRGLPIERVREIARGRVWTGADAKAHGLVDELGGFWTAVAAARKAAEIDEAERVVFRRYPEEPSAWEVLGRMFGATAGGMKALQGLYALMQAPGVRELVDAAAAREAQGPQFRAPGLPVR